jgi:hypothetical protein
VIKRTGLFLAAGFACAACGVPAPPSSTGGVHVESNAGCPGALVAVSSDYASTSRPDGGATDGRTTSPESAVVRPGGAEPLEMIDSERT